jgi:hypothetical protein
MVESLLVARDVVVNDGAFVGSMAVTFTSTSRLFAVVVLVCGLEDRY